VSTFSDRVLDGLGPTFAERAGDQLEPLVDGLTVELEATDTLVSPTARGWATVFDLDTTPQPGWLGRAFGTKVPGGLTLEEERAFVRDQAAWRRGSLNAMAAAVQAKLTGTKRVGFVERDGTPWRISLVVYSGEMTGTTEELLAVAATQKPVGLVLDGVTTLDAPTFADIAADYESFDALAAAFESYDQITIDDDLPGVSWWRPNPIRFARLKALAPTFADSLAMFPTFRDIRDYEEA
jgi:hypothetical protein